MALGNKYRGFFANLQRSDVQEQIRFLRQRLPRRATAKNYQLTLAMVKKATWRSANLQEHLQRMADLLCKHLRITRRVAVVTINTVDAGRFQIDDGLITIFVNSDLKDQNYAQKVAILAHELSHYYLMHQHGIIIPNERDNELLTEINAVYTGMGFLLLKGYQPNERQMGNKVYRSTVGYVNPETVLQAIQETAIARRQQPWWVLRNLGFPYNLQSVGPLWPLIKDYYAARRARKAAATKENETA